MRLLLCVPCPSRLGLSKTITYRTVRIPEATSVRVDVKVQVDTDIVTTQIDSLRKNEAAKAEIQRLRAETETLYRKLADLNATVGSSTPGTAAEVLQHRGQAMNRVEANALLSQAWSFLDLLKVTEESQHRAKSLTEKAVAIDPGNSQGHSTLGYIRYRYKDFVGARQEFQEAIQLDRNNLSAHDYLGHVLYDLGDFENAAFHYEEAIRIGGELSKHFVEWLLHSAYEKLGKQAQTQGNFDSAASYFTKMIRLHPESFGGYLWLGDALLEKGDTDAAIKEYRTAVLLNPNFAGTHLVLGQALKAKGNLAGSIVEFQMAVRLDPAFGKGHAQSQYGIALYESGRIEEAISELRTAIRLRPDEGNLHHFLDTVVTRCLPRVRYI